MQPCVCVHVFVSVCVLVNMHCLMYIHVTKKCYHEYYDIIISPFNVLIPCAVFGLFCWTGIVDLFIGLELNGFVSNFMGFYLLEGEPYLNTSHGMFINYWDGTVQYALQLSSIALFCLQ